MLGLTMFGDDFGPEHLLPDLQRRAREHRHLDLHAPRAPRHRRHPVPRLGADHLERPRALVAALALAVVLVAPAGARADDRALLERYRPVYVHDAQRAVPGRGRARALPPASYGRAVAGPRRRALAAVLALAHEEPAGPRDRAHRPHEGDWELVQVRVDAGGAAGRGGLRPAQRRRALRMVERADPRRRAGRLPRQRLARRLLPARRARPHVPRPQRRGRRARPREAGRRSS